MNIVVIKEHNTATHETGGEYAIDSLEVFVDDSLRPEVQRDLVIHAIIENYCRSWEHGKVVELVELISDALYQLS